MSKAITTPLVQLGFELISLRIAISDIERPVNERALMLVVAGYPAPDAVVPDLHRKAVSEIATFR